MVQRNLILIIILFSSCLTVFSQEKVKKINFTILDASFDIGDIFYQDSSDEYWGNYEEKSPFSIGANIGFEYPINKYLGLESGFRISYYIKKMKETETEINQKRDIDGIYWGPYFSPKIYLVPFQNGSGALYIENRFSLAYSTINLPSGLNMKRRYDKMIFLYDLVLGAHCKVSNNSFFNIIVGYNSFSFSKIKKFENNKIKNKTPFQFGMGVSFAL